MPPTETPTRIAPSASTHAASTSTRMEPVTLPPEMLHLATHEVASMLRLPREDTWAPRGIE